MEFIQGDLPVFSKVAMSGDTQHLWIHILQGELLYRDCIHFILQKENNINLNYMLLSRAIITLLWKYFPHQQEWCSGGLQKNLRLMIQLQHCHLITAVHCNTPAQKAANDTTVEHLLLALKHSFCVQSHSSKNDLYINCLGRWSNKYKFRLTCTHNCKCWPWLGSGPLIRHWWVCWHFGQCPPRWHTPGQERTGQDEAHVDWVGAETTGQRSYKVSLVNLKEILYPQNDPVYIVVLLIVLAIHLYAH